MNAVLSLLRTVPALIWYAVLFAIAWVIHKCRRSIGPKRDMQPPPEIVFRVEMTSGQYRRI